MSRLRLNTGAKPSAPAANKVEIYATTDANRYICSIDENGRVRVMNTVMNASTASQAIAAASRTYITGSAIAIPTAGLQVGTVIRWFFNITKTAAGTAASTYDIAFGTTATTADTARVSFTKPAGTAVVDEGAITIRAVVRGPISATGVVVGNFQLTHNLAATGHATIPCVCVNTVSAAFDLTTPTYVGVCATTGASDAITVQQMVAEMRRI